MLGEDALEQQLAQARVALREAQRTVAAPERVESVAEAADGRIRVSLGPDGRCSAVELDPRVLREGSEYLAEELRRAVNAALDGQSEAVTGTEPMPDLAAMTVTLERLQDQGLRQMREISATISDTMRKLQRRS
ncbi:YbaB/EbfC family nucleoid-associated protein [Micromonospora sp. KC723]|uniref:YbaB/EbfC family nucleoid-associated protein n=1 Tax=Micromonospora sp. KC723 TaxID=2530381 RepID=UPI0010477B50|nr:YbaB/EbfC family nucleoid-associated protein [Micromonospora sp. KC723]TDB75929.1 YbaB/EbfC family DNA-binding protein [Micromonospora sp. KC723]